MLYHGIQNPTPILTDFVKSNIEGILDACFNSSDLSTGAYYVLTNICGDIMTLIIRNNNFFDKAINVLSGNPPNQNDIGKIANILVHILDVYPNPPPSATTLFLQLLPYIENQSVLDLYIQVTISSSPYQLFQRNLTNACFSQVINLELLPDAPEEKIACICRVIRHCSHNEVLSPTFLNEDLIDKLIIFTLKKETFILNQVWQALSAMTTPQTIEYVHKIVPLAIGIVDAPLVHIAPYVVFAIDLLAKCLNIDSMHVADFNDRSFEQIISRLIVQFPDCTNLQGALFRFIHAAMKYDSYAKRFFSVVGFIIIDEAKSFTKSSSRINSIILLNEIMKLKSSSVVKTVIAEIYDLRQIQKAIIDPYFNILNNKYGGSLPLM